MKFKNKYYLIEGEPWLTVARDYVDEVFRVCSEVWEYVESIGASHYWRAGKDGRLFAVGFDGTPPDGFRKPNRKGQCIPKKSSEYAAQFAALPILPDPRESILSVAEIPTRISYGGKHGRGSMSIGNLFEPMSIACFHGDGPFLLRIPDVAAEIADLKAQDEGIIIEGGLDDWRMDETGLRAILIEEWNLMEARHKLSKAAA